MRYELPFAAGSGAFGVLDLLFCITTIAKDSRLLTWHTREPAI